jgi:hypothetical protein
MSNRQKVPIGSGCRQISDGVYEAWFESLPDPKTLVSFFSQRTYGNILNHNIKYEISWNGYPNISELSSQKKKMIDIY